MRSKVRVLVLLAAVTAMAGSALCETYWVAAVAHLPGAEGTRWRTDLSVLNPCDVELTVGLRLHTASGIFEGDFIVPAGEQQVFADVVALLADGDIKGSLELEVSGEAMVTSRTYNVAPSGTFGQSIDGMPSDAMFEVDDVVFLQQLREDEEFRTNIGVLNAGDTTAMVTVELYDRHGASVGTFDLAVPAGRTIQENRPFRDRFGRTDVLAGSARIIVVSGSAVYPYASVVDDGTGDPTTIAPKAATACQRDIAQQLAEIAGMTVVEVPSGLSGYRKFDLEFLQPADHDDPEGEQLSQHLSLLHRSFDAPMVLNTQGYDLWVGRTELMVLLESNQIQVEHRFFGGSVPASGDWSLLTIEQAAADHHRIVEALEQIYGGSWINTGYSKGGMTASYHRRFYPDDVDATVSYVAPLSLGAPDDRYLDFLANVGTPACNQALWAVQREALGRRDAMLALLAARPGLSFDRIGGIERAFECIVVEAPFAFWQYAGETYCSQIPVATASDQAIFDFFDTFVGWSFASDPVWNHYAAYYYQAQTELGYPAVARDHLADLLHTDAPDPEEGLPPAGTDPVYVPTAMPDIAQWVATEGERLMFIYGEYDPWTGGAYELGDATDSYVYVNPGGTHGSGIGSLEPDDEQEALATIARWAGVTLTKRLREPVADLHPPWRREARPGRAPTP